MALLIFQYLIFVLICLWSARPLHPLHLGKHLKVPVFSLQCLLIIIFLVGYTYVQEAYPRDAEGAGPSLTNAIVDFVVFCVIPALYLFVRKRLQDRQLRLTDIIHVLTPLIFFTAFLVRPGITGGEQAGGTSDTLSSRTIYSYLAMAIYLLLLLKVVVDRFGESAQGVRIDHLNEPAVRLEGSHTINRAGNVDLKPEIIMGVSEVRIGSFVMDEEEVCQVDRRIESVLDEKKPFLNKRYTLAQLSADVGMPVHHLSAFINQHYKINFSDFINERRVRYVQQKIKEGEWRTHTLEAIAQDCGFNNRNTLTSAFKKFTSYNPSEFVRMTKDSQKN